MERLNLTQKWDKVFPKSDKVDHKKVTFHNRYCITLAADLYTPKGAEGKPAVSLVPGSVVEIPANVKHWHGAKADSWFSHLAMEIPGEECSNEWLEPVTDEQYNAL